MSTTVADALFTIWRDARQQGDPARFGQRRLAGRAGEFGLADDYAVAVAAVDSAIRNRAGAIDRRRVITARIAEAIGQPMPDGHYPALPADKLAALAAVAQADSVAWAACEHVTADAIERGLPVPDGLRHWAIAAMQDTTRPDGRCAQWETARDDAIRFAVRLALESGAFRGATHSAQSQKPGTELREGRAHSACELVAQRMTAADVGAAVSYEQAAKVWRQRNRELDVSETIRK